MRLELVRELHTVDIHRDRERMVTAVIDLHEPGVDSQHELTPRPRRGMATAPFTRKQQLLVAHSDRLLLGLVTSALCRDGYHVSSTFDGLDLLDWLACCLISDDVRRPDLIICELDLPGRRGLDLLADLRYAGWEVPFILTAKVQQRTKANAARRLGSVIVFESPFDIDDLRTAAAVLLDRSRIDQVFSANLG